ncbi:NYN domain-containing protein [Arthrobacter oryzae]|uniref:NYN domain-containing protein n=1 Tax=Arthrobacter oryzae TaxID=409290 RepID=A0A3N0C3B0_9MICC|nr:NYN domain-containing protein [Arthrobacter oryzae]RNL57115.1 NYN domain-containing protein [Arthrobacter oryzae]
MIEQPFQSRRPGTRAAMFVDFDNVYTGLQALDPAAAKRFAEDPKHWMEALAGDGSGGNSRRFLIRNCYLNPVVYSKYRTFWTRAGFRVVDCPSLTQRGKSSTDINLVLEAMDALAGNGGIEEFFLASADADFTSLIQRFRAADRMTTVIAAGAVAFAYREMADHVVESHDFVAILNGTSADIVPRMVRPIAPPGPLKSGPAASGAATAAVGAVRTLVQNAPGPVTGAVVAHTALTAEPALKSDWGGYGKFGTWIAQLGGGIEYSSAPGPGWVWDAARFSRSDLPPAAEIRPAVEEQIARVTDVPALSTAQFRQMFLSMESTLRDPPANRNELAKSVRDGCVAAGQAVARQAVNFVIQGLLVANFPLSGQPSAAVLAAAWTKNVEELCRVALLEFEDTEMIALRRWASGGLLEPGQAAAPRP